MNIYTFNPDTRYKRNTCICRHRISGHGLRVPYYALDIQFSHGDIVLMRFITTEN